jgi:hypothetical protein
LTALLASAGLEPIEHAKVGRRVTLRFAADRLRRAGVPLAGAVGEGVTRLGIGDRTVRLNPGDIMSVVARRPASA